MLAVRYEYAWLVFWNITPDVPRKWTVGQFYRMCDYAQERLDREERGA